MIPILPNTYKALKSPENSLYWEVMEKKKGVL